MKTLTQMFMILRCHGLNSHILRFAVCCRAVSAGGMRVMVFFACVCLMIGTPAWGEFISDYDTLSPASLVSYLRNIPPLNFCGEEVPLSNRDVRERLEREFLVTVWNRPQVILWMKRSSRYMPYIEEMLKQNSMPEDLKYLVLVESSLISHVTSPKGAKGYWQFMEGTAKKYGLSINSHVDERRNFFFSTRAALRYLKELHTMLGSWTLAAAAYNMGEEGLKAEMLVQKTSDYYLLYLPVETQRYIFRAISAKLILSDLKKYGYVFRSEDLYLPLQSDRVEVVCDEAIPIFLIARAAGTHFKEIKDLNPEIRGHYLERGRHVILVPRGGGADGFSSRYEELLRQWKEERKNHVYVVKKGESLSSIASQFNVPLPVLLIWNRLESRKRVKPGDRLFVFPGEMKIGKDTK